MKKKLTIIKNLSFESDSAQDKQTFTQTKLSLIYESYITTKIIQNQCSIYFCEIFVSLNYLKLYANQGGQKCQNFIFAWTIEEKNDSCFTFLKLFYFFGRALTSNILVRFENIFKVTSGKPNGAQLAFMEHL